MEAKLQYYFLTIPSEKNELYVRIALPKDEKRKKANGLVTGKEGITDHTQITTGFIKEAYDDRIITESGFEYKLGEMHPEYKEVLNMFKENPNKLLKNWLLVREEDSKYMLVGESVEHEYVHGIVVEQCGNWVTLENGEAYLVIWKNMNDLARFNTMLRHEYEGLKYPDDFEKSLEYICKPKLITK